MVASFEHPASSASVRPMCPCAIAGCAQTPDAAVTARAAFDRASRRRARSASPRQPQRLRSHTGCGPCPWCCSIWRVRTTVWGAFGRRLTTTSATCTTRAAPSTQRAAQVQTNIAPTGTARGVQLGHPPTARVKSMGASSAHPRRAGARSGRARRHISAPTSSPSASAHPPLGERRAPVRLEPWPSSPRRARALRSRRRPPLVTQPAELRPTLDPRVQVQPPTDAHETPVVRRWWFWTGIGAVIVGGAVAGMAAAGVFNVTAAPPTGVNYAVDALSSRW